MKKSVLVLIFSVILVSCGASNSAKKYTYKKPVSASKNTSIKRINSSYSGNVSGKRKSIVAKAENYLGVPYKYAGNTPSGFDCSGLVCKVFDENQVTLPRRSQDQAKYGNSIETSNIKPGDLLFFATAGGSTISHVGIVHHILDNGEITFIHSSTSKGVIISSLNEVYWNKAFLFARTVL